MVAPDSMKTEAVESFRPILHTVVVKLKVFPRRIFWFFVKGTYFQGCQYRCSGVIWSDSIDFGCSVRLYWCS